MTKAPQTGDKSPSLNTKAATAAHLLHTTGNELGHTVVHIKKAMKSKNPKELALNLEHALKHGKSGIEHTQKSMDHMVANYPAEGKELKDLHTTMPSVADRVKTAHRAVKGK